MAEVVELADWRAAKVRLQAAERFDGNMADVLRRGAAHYLNRMMEGARAHAATLRPAKASARRPVARHGKGSGGVHLASGKFR